MGRLTIIWLCFLMYVAAAYSISFWFGYFVYDASQNIWKAVGWNTGLFAAFISLWFVVRAYLKRKKNVRTKQA